MSAKFVSKNSNYMLVLKPGIEGNRNLGTHAIPGLYIKFQSGLVDIKDEAIAEQLRSHPSCGSDFIEVKQDEVDPFSGEREEIEPGHVISEIKYGHNEKAAGTAPAAKMTPQLKKLIEAEAIKMLPGLLKSNPKVLKEIITGLAAEMKASEPEAVSSTKEQTEVPAPVEAKTKAENTKNK
jgi:hypothetical protein